MRRLYYLCMRAPEGRSGKIDQILHFYLIIPISGRSAHLSIDQGWYCSMVFVYVLLSTVELLSVATLSPKRIVLTKRTWGIFLQYRECVP
jgi:hypothetical protein